MTSLRLAGALTAAAVLLVPAVASAHPSVYTSTAKVVPAGSPPPATQAELADQVRYVVTNHGFSYVLRETNGVTDHGVLNFSVVPGAYRNQAGYEPGPAGTRTRLLAEADSGAQAHATCANVAALEDEAAILAWQGEDPFFNYVPFQKTSAGLEDDPATWIAVVKARTGVDLATVADAETTCETTLSGDYVEADATQTTAAAFAAGTVEHETAPLVARIATLTKAVTDAETAKATVQGLLDAAKAELAKLATPLRATLASARLKGAALAKRGTAVTVSGLAGAPVEVELAIPERQARKLKLKSSVLASAKATLGADGTATVALKAKRPARKALRKLKRSVAVEVTARSGDRFSTSGGTVGR